MSFSHLLILGIIAVIVIPPEKLPEVARQVARFLGELRRMSSGIFDNLQKDPGPQLKPEDNQKRYEQQTQAQAQTQTTQAPVTPAAPEPPVQVQPDPAAEKAAQEEYLRHIQGDPAPPEAKTTPDQKKPKHE